MDDIANYNTYTSYMAKSWYDKAFFLDKIEIGSFVDFGCADGTMGYFLNAIDSSYLYAGYDINERMVHRANIILMAGRHMLTNKWATSNWDDITEHIAQINQPSAAIVNSIIHEVYNSSKEVIDDFWEKLFTAGFKYICIRDMVPPTYHAQLVGGRYADLNELTRADDSDLRKVLAHADKNLLKSFEKRWGPITREKNLIHFLLKYRYKENWNHEVEENYLSIDNNTFWKKISTMNTVHGYHTDWQERFSLKFIRDEVMKDFGVYFPVQTHIKVILKKND